MSQRPQETPWSRYAPAAAWDEVATAGERVARVARRHIEDEEEIVIPVVLGMTG